jgi:hypothetical protein
MSERSALRRAVGRVGHGLREVATLPQALVGGDRPRLAVCPSGSMSPRDDLRAYALGRTLRARGWSVMIVPKQLGWSQRQRLFRLFRPDLLLFQTCRHGLNDADHAMGHPWVLDLDDADFLDVALQDRMERTAAGAAGVVAGSRFIRDWARRFNPQVRVIWTGTPQTAGEPPDHAARPRVVTWAQSGPLGYPAEVAFVADLQRRLLARGEAFRLRLYGVNTPEDEARLRASFEPGSDLELLPFMTYRAFLASLREVAVGLSPIIAASPFSRGKSFGKILGYLDAGVPVVCSDEADHALFFTARSGVVSNDPDVWAEAVARLLNDPAARNDMAAQATQAFRSRLTIDVAADLTDRFLRDLLGRPAK